MEIKCVIVVVVVPPFVVVVAPVVVAQLLAGACVPCALAIECNALQKSLYARHGGLPLRTVHAVPF